MTHTGFAEVNGTRLYYESAGQGQPVVFVHGFSLDRRMWDDQFEIFAQHYRVVRYDLRGFGQSALPTSAYAHTDDLAALLQQLDITSAHLIGLSLGGGIVLDFALTHPELTHTLSLVDSALGGYTTSPVWDEAVTPVWVNGRAGNLAVAKQLWLTLDLFTPANEQPAVGARLLQMVADYSGWHWLNHDTHQALTPPAIQQLHTINTPTLIVRGERDLPDLHVIANTMQQRIPNARKVVLSHVGHMANMDAPQAFNEGVLDFLSHHA